MANTSKKLIPLIVLGLLVLIGVGTVVTVGLVRSADEQQESPDSRRDNALLLIDEYIRASEYTRALDLLERLLLDDPQDQQVRDLLSQVIELRRQAQARAEQDSIESRTQQQPGISPEVLQAQQEREAALARAATAEAREREAAAREREAAAAQREAEAEIARQLALQRQREEAERQAEAERQRQEEEARIARLSAEEAAKQRQITQLIQDARRAQDESRFSEARRLLSQALELDPQNALVNARMADAFFSEDPTNRINQDQASTFAQEAKALDPNLWESYFTLGRIYSQQRDFPRAITEFTQASQRQPGTANARVLFELGNTQFLAGRFADARDSYQASIRIDSSNERAFFNLGSALDQLGQRQEALDAYRRAFSVRPDYASAYNRAGEIQRSLGDLDGAVRNLSRAAELDPSIRHNRSYANALYELGRFEDALSLYRRVVQQEPNNAINNYNLATVLIDLNQPEEALSFAAQAVQIDGNRAEYVYTLGLAASMLGGYDQAEEFLLRAIQLNPQYLLPRIELGALYLELEDPESALMVLQDALRLAPQSVETLLNMGAAQRQLGNLNESATTITQAIELRPQDPSVHFSLALTRIRQERWNDARQSLERTISLDSTFWQAYHRLGEVFIALDNPTRARDQFNQLLQLNPNYLEREMVEALMQNL